MGSDGDSVTSGADGEQVGATATEGSSELLAQFPPLMGDPSFLGMLVTQFLGAFNDNLFKQLMLLLAIPVAMSKVQMDNQAVATFVFALPFVVFSGVAGYLSDRFSKRTIVVLSKVAEIGVMALGLAGFLLFAATGYSGLLAVLFLMGLQSTFFGPGKYGILPEMLRESDLPRANGLMLMTTFLAIILGTASAGQLKDLCVPPGAPLADSARNLAWGSLACVVIAVAGTLSSLRIRRVRPSQPELPFGLSNWGVPWETRQCLANDRPLLAALLASSVFWLFGGVAMQTVNLVGVQQMQLSATLTSILTATVGIGIAAGAVVAGKISRGHVDFRVVRWGVWGMFLFLLPLALTRGNLALVWDPGPRPDAHVLGFAGSVPFLILVGGAAGFFAIPLQVFIQSRPPAEIKGRVIAAMNQVNFIAILLASPVYWVFQKIVVYFHWPRSYLYVLTALLLLPVIIFYRPDRRLAASQGPAEGGK